MNLFGWIGIFFILGGFLFASAALSMRGGKRIVAVEAKIVAVRNPSGETEKEQSREEDDEEENATEYEFDHEGETLRVGCHTMTSRDVGESERMYYDTFGGALYHPRMLGSMFAAAAAFALAGILLILLQDTLMR